MRVLVVHRHLVYHHLGSLHRSHGESAHTHVGQVCPEQVVPFAIVEQGEIVVAHVALGLAHGVVAFIAEQQVIGRGIVPAREFQAVVPCSIAEEQQVAWPFLGCGRTVVEHFQVAAVGIAVGGAAGELVVQLVGSHQVHAQSVMLLMQPFQPFGLRLQFPAGRNDDDHVGPFVGMPVLRRYGSHHLRHRQVC